MSDKPVNVNMPLQPSANFEATALAVAFQIFLHDSRPNANHTEEDMRKNARLVREMAAILMKDSALG